MDFFEIVMDIEDRFGISLRISETMHVRTVGDLVGLIQERNHAARRETCPTLPAFLDVRKTVRDVLGDQSARLRPRDAVCQILKPAQRRELWNHLTELLGIPMHGLSRPALLGQAVIFGSIGFLVFALWLAWTIDLAILPLTVCLALGGMIFLSYVTRPFCTVPPKGLQTFGEITRKLVSTQVATKMIHLRTDEEILQELRPLLVKILYVEASEIVPAARLIEDLGMN